MNKIKINSTNGFLNMEALPHNCIFNKVITGCGGTTIALRSDENYIIAVPTTELIINKTKSDTAGLHTVTIIDKEVTMFGAFGVWSEIKDALEDYLNSEGTKKVICTYDKVDAITKMIAPTDYKILIDEYHSLLKAYSYRSKAINGVLNNFKSYKSYCFLSATPITPDFKPYHLNDVEELEAEWSDIDRLIVSLQKSTKPYLTISKVIKAYKKDGYIIIDGKKSTEAFIFVNSVTDIVNILQHCKLTTDDVRIICANKVENQYKINEYDSRIKVGSSNSESKMFTFITSKAFEGVDFFSEDGMCFVVSSASNKNTLLSIDTDIPQIAGRIRTKNNPFKNKMIHIFSTSKNKIETNYEEVKKRTDEQLKAATKLAELYNSSDESVREFLKIKDKLNDYYIDTDENGSFIVNDTLVKLELYNTKVNNVIYGSGLALRKEYSSNGIITTNINFNTEDGSMIKKVKAKKISFEEAFKKYATIKSNIFSLEDTEELIREQPLIVEAYNKLGVDKVRKLRYIKSAIKAELLKDNNSLNVDTKITRLLMQKLTMNTFYSNEQIREAITKVYSTLDITDRVTAKSIDKWFMVKAIEKRNEDKSRTKGYALIKSNIIFKD